MVILPEPLPYCMITEERPSTATLVAALDTNHLAVLVRLTESDSTLPAGLFPPTLSESALKRTFDAEHPHAMNKNNIMAVQNVNM